MTLSYDCYLRTRVDLLTTVADDADHHFLPVVLTPRLAAIALTHISNVLHNPMHRPRKWAVILVVHGHDQSTRRTIMHLTERGAFIFEVIPVTNRSRIAHVSKRAFIFFMGPEVE